MYNYYLENLYIHIHFSQGEEVRTRVSSIYIKLWATAKCRRVDVFIKSFTFFISYTTLSTFTFLFKTNNTAVWAEHQLEIITPTCHVETTEDFSLRQKKKNNIQCDCQRLVRSACKPWKSIYIQTFTETTYDKKNHSTLSIVNTVLEKE